MEATGSFSKIENPCAHPAKAHQEVDEDPTPEVDEDPTLEVSEDLTSEDLNLIGIAHGRIVCISPSDTKYAPANTRPSSAPPQNLRVHLGSLTSQRFHCLATRMSTKSFPGYYAHIANLLNKITKRSGLQFLHDGKSIPADNSSALTISPKPGVYTFKVVPTLDLGLLPQRLREISVQFQQVFKDKVATKAHGNPAPKDAYSRLEVIRTIAVTALYILVKSASLTEAEAAVVTHALNEISLEDMSGDYESLYELLNIVGRTFHLRLFGVLSDCFPHLYKKEKAFGLDIGHQQMNDYGYDRDDLIFHEECPLVKSSEISITTDPFRRDELTLKSTNNIRTAFLASKVRAAISWLFAGIDYPAEFDYNPFIALKSIGFEHITDGTQKSGDLVVYLKKEVLKETDTSSGYSAVHWAVLGNTKVLSMMDPFPALWHMIQGPPASLRGHGVAMFKYIPGGFERQITDIVKKSVTTLSQSLGGGQITILAELNSSLLGVYNEIDTWTDSLGSDATHGQEYYTDLKHRIAQFIPSTGDKEALKLLKKLLSEVQNQKIFNHFFALA